MTLHVEIIFSPGPSLALFHEQVLFHSGMTVEEALNRTTLYSQYPETKSFTVGIFSKKVDLRTILSPGDRIEVYRPLSLNPKDRRRQKALSRQPSK